MGKSLVNNGKKWENHGKSILMLHVWNIDLHFNLCGWIILGNQRINLPSNKQGHAGSMLIWGRVISVPYYLLLEIVQVWITDLLVCWLDIAVKHLLLGWMVGYEVCTYFFMLDMGPAQDVSKKTGNPSPATKGTEPTNEAKRPHGQW